MNLNKLFKKSHVEIESYLDLLFLFAKDSFIMQIGANDGQLCDPIRKYFLELLSNLVYDNVVN